MAEPSRPMEGESGQARAAVSIAEEAGTHRDSFFVSFTLTRLEGMWTEESDVASTLSRHAIIPTLDGIAPSRRSLRGERGKPG